MAQEGEKIVLKAGVVREFLSDLELSPDGEFFLFSTLDMSNRGVEALNKFVEEAKEVYTCNLSQNNIPDPSNLKEFQNLVRLNLGKNKIKNITIFT